MLSVLLEFAMFPTSADGREGSSVSKQVSKVIDAIDKSGVPYQLTAMGTIIEAKSMKEALGIVELAYEQLEDCERVYSSLKFDIRKNSENRLQTKVEEVEKTLNRKVNSSINTYKRVSCHFYDELESAAVKKILCTILYKDEEDEREIQQKIVDLKIINKAEYMILDNDQKIRLDKIVLFNDINPNDAKYC